MAIIQQQQQLRSGAALRCKQESDRAEVPKITQHVRTADLMSLSYDIFKLKWLSTDRVCGQSMGCKPSVWGCALAVIRCVGARAVGALQAEGCLLWAAQAYGAAGLVQPPASGEPQPLPPGLVHWPLSCVIVTMPPCDHTVSVSFTSSSSPR